jgi:MFS family permease
MQQKTSYNFGARGWLLILWVATGMFSYVVAGNYPLNIMSLMGPWGDNSTLSLIYSGASIVGIIVQVIFSRKVRAWKKLSVILGIATLVFLCLEMLLPPGLPWMISFGLATAISALYGTWALSVLVGVWFPRRKGTVMGIITFAFPIGNALLGGFQTRLGGLLGENVAPQMAGLLSLWPYVAVVFVGFILGVILISEFPEQVGAYRDNDKSLTPEIANEMMRQEIENRKTTVWTTGHTLKSADFWLITVPMGLLLLFAIGAMTQSFITINHYIAIGDGGLIDKVGGYNTVMLIIAGAGIVGSYVFGLIDTKFGTRKAILFSHVLMLVSAILGTFDTGSMVFIALVILGLFMGASSNYTVSAAVQYWRIEDFPSVFSVVNPVANFINAFGPFLVAGLIGSQIDTANVKAMFIASGIAAIISIICCLLFKPARVKEIDDIYRAAAGKPLDDVLVGRK